MSAIFGGSKSKSTQRSTSKSNTYNQAYGDIRDSYNPAGSRAYNTAMNARTQELSGGFQGYLDNSGFDFEQNRGLQSILSNMGAKGVSRSGAAMKSLSSFDRGIRSSYYDKYLGQQAETARLGLNAGSLLGQTGGVSNSSGSSYGNSTSSSNPGIGGFVGGAASIIAKSDIRLKKDVKNLGTYGEVGLYSFRYKDQNDNEPSVIGVMAQEVKDKYPEALGPETEDGFMTVDYGKLKQSVEG